MKRKNVILPLPQQRPKRHNITSPDIRALTFRDFARD